MARLGASVKKTGLFWLYHIVGIVLIIIAIMFAPFWEDTDVFFASWGSKIINIMISCAIFLYLILYLARKVKSSPNQTILILTVIEFILLFVVALGGILSQFDILKIKGPSQIIALALWLRGSIEVIRAYYYRRDVSVTYPVWYVLVAIAMISLGVYLFAKPMISSTLLQWILCLICIAIGIVFIVTGVHAKPKK